jgi:glycosyltransferase involved in cell wall biosynthesis
MTAGPVVSIVIPARNAGQTIGPLLDDLAAGPGDRAEVIVVDDASDDDTAATVGAVALRFPGARLVRGEGRGPAAARNLGAGHATGAWLAFVDADVRLPAGWLARGLAATEQPVDVVEGVLQPQGGDDRGLVRHAAVSDGGGVFVSANLWVRREWFDQVGGFDEGYRAPWREDTDLGWRLVDAGARTTTDHRLLALHPYCRRPVTSLLRPGGRILGDSRLRARFPARARALKPRRELRRSYAAVLAVVGAAVAAAAGWTVAALALLVLAWVAAVAAALPLVAARGPAGIGEWAAFVALAPVIALVRVGWVVWANVAHRVWFW